ncbi:MAG: ATP-binding protein [Betaproteobacteria bacterium]|nr:ATP-binding protein [Betaproteobacteria bacterium]
MNEQELAQAFDRFYRADPSGKRPGTGLGLSLCQDIMNLLGGLILLRSAPQQGTTVTLLFVQADLPVGHSPPEPG